MAIRADVLRRVRERLAAPLPTPAETEDRLTAAFAAARPFVVDACVTAEQFALYLADRLPPDSDLDAELRQRALGDLYLACGCAFRAAFAALRPAERNLLRYHTIERLSIDELAPLLGVGRSTAATTHRRTAPNCF